MKTQVNWDATPKTTINWDSAPTQPKTKIQWHATPVQPTPHSLDTYIQKYAHQYGVDPGLLQKLGYQETNLGTGPNYNQSTGRDRDSNQGVGPFQKDLSWKGHLSKQDETYLDRIAKDPAYATEQAALQFSGILKHVGGDTRKALSIWNTGGVNAKGLSYADSVLGQNLAPLQVQQPSGSALKPRQRTTWEQPTQRGRGKKNTPVQESPLRTALDYLSLPVAYIQAAVSDASVHAPKEDLRTGEGLFGQGPNLRQLQKDLSTGGPSAVAQNDIFPAHGALMRIIQDPHASPQNKATAKWFLKHPFMSGAFDFIQQFENPAYEGKIIGPIMKQAAKLPIVGDAMEVAEHAGNVINQAVVRPITSPVGKAIVKTGLAGLQSIPGETGNAIRSLFDRYTKAGLPQRGGSSFTHAGLGAVMYPEHQVGEAEQFIDNIGQGLTPAQAREVQKLSYQETTTGERLAVRDPSVPEPKGVSLEARAHALRTWMKERDIEQNHLGIRDIHQGEQYDTGTFWPMRQFDDKAPVYKAHELQPDESAGANDEVTAQSVARRVGGRSRYASTLPPSRRKLYSTILNPEVESALHPEYDPFYQLKQHYAPTVRAIANEQVKRDLERLPSIDPETGEQRVSPILGEGERPLYARMPLNFARTRPSGEVQVFGTGEKGEAAMQNYAHRLAKARARNRAAKDPNVLRIAEQEGVDPSKLGTRAIVQRSVAPVAARLGEAQRAGKLTGRLSKRAQDALDTRADVELEAQQARETPKAKITAKTSEDAAAAVRAQNYARAQALSPTRLAHFRAKQVEAARAAGVDAKQAERVGDITARYVRQVSTTKTAQAFAQATDRYYREISGDILKNLRAESTRLPKGYVKESDLRIGSPSSRDMAIDESFANLFKQSVPAQDRMAAEKLWQSYQMLNRLMRSLIVLFPTVHAINNLGMHFLAEGGSPVEMAQILAGRYIAHPGEEARAARAGALSAHPAENLFGRTGTHATTDLGSRAKMITEKTHVPQPVVRGYLGLSDMKQRMNDWLFGSVQRNYELSLFHKFTTELGMNDGQAAMKVREAMGRFDEVNDQVLNKLFYFVPWMRTVIPYWAKKGVIDPKWWAAPVSGTRTQNQLAGYDDPSKPFQYTYGKDKKGNWILIPEPIPQRILGMEADVSRLPYDLTLPAGDNRNQMLTHDVSSPLNYLAGHENPVVGAISSFAQLASNDVPPWNPFKAEPGENPVMTFAKKEASNAIAPLGHIDSPAVQEDPWLLLGYPFGSSPYLKPDARHAMVDRNIRSQITKLTNQMAETTSPIRKATLQAHIQGLQRRIDNGGVTTPIKWNAPRTPITWAAPKTPIQWSP